MNKVYEKYLEDDVVNEDNAVDIIDAQQEEIERLNNVLKEAIEYIEKPISLIYKKDCGNHFKKLLDILKQKRD